MGEVNTILVVSSDAGWASLIESVGDVYPVKEVRQYQFDVLGLRFVQMRGAANISGRPIVNTVWLWYCSGVVWFDGVALDRLEVYRRVTYDMVVGLIHDDMVRLSCGRNGGGK